MSAMPADAVAMEQRLRLLRGLPAFAQLPEATLGRLAGELREARFPAGQVVVSEGDAGDVLFIIASGQAEVSIRGSSGPVPMATLEAGELFGELALLRASAERAATVTALTELQSVSLQRAAFERLLDEQPAVRETLVRGMDAMLEASLLKRASPFSSLGADRLRELAQRVERLNVESGDTIVRQGEAGTTCYLITKGGIEVVLEGEAPRRLATLGPGNLFGESALLTDAPRNATARALEPSSLIVLDRRDLLELMGEERQLSAQLLDLVGLRGRPRQKAGVTAHERVDSAGERIIVLKDPARGAYFRLSPEGHFLWQRMDGSHSARDLVLDYFERYKAFAPGVVAQVAGGLAAAGFVETSRPRADVIAALQGTVPLWMRALAGLRRVLDWHVMVRNVDGWFAAAYRYAGRWLVAPPGLALLASVALGGLVAFAARGLAPAMQSGDPRLWFFLVPALVLSIVVHELGHGLAVKASGREVLGVGIGWYWVSPIALVDTSDMWLAGRKARMAVNLAGIATNLVLAGVAVLVACLAGNVVVVAALWQFALISYVLVLANLNPLLEYDGYYVLMDWIERPNLRAHCLDWLRGNLAQIPRDPARVRGHAMELCYGLASLAYLVVMGALATGLGRRALEHWAG